MDSRTKKTNNKRFVRYSEGAEMYSMSVSTNHHGGAFAK